MFGIDNRESNIPSALLEKAVLYNEQTKLLFEEKFLRVEFLMPFLPVTLRGNSLLENGIITI